MGEKYKQLVTLGGGMFIDLHDNHVVRFRAEPQGHIITLYASALRSPTDVALAVKNYFESREMSAWQAGV